MIRTLADFKVYNLAMSLGEEVWQWVLQWNYFEKDTVGKQFVRATDSIAANLFEGLGRYHYKETKNFSYYSRDSLFETKTWLVKASHRSLIDESKFKKLLADLELIGKMLNSYINTLGQVKEPQEEYSITPTPQSSNTQFLSPNTPTQTPNAQVPIPNPQ